MSRTRDGTLMVPIIILMMILLIAMTSAAVNTGPEKNTAAISAHEMNLENLAPASGRLSVTEKAIDQASAEILGSTISPAARIHDGVLNIDKTSAAGFARNNDTIFDLTDAAIPATENDRGILCALRAHYRSGHDIVLARRLFGYLIANGDDPAGDLSRYYMIC